MGGYSFDCCQPLELFGRGDFIVFSPAGSEIQRFGTIHEVDKEKRTLKVWDGSDFTTISEDDFHRFGVMDVSSDYVVSRLNKLYVQ